MAVLRGDDVSHAFALASVGIFGAANGAEQAFRRRLTPGEVQRLTAGAEITRAAGTLRPIRPALVEPSHSAARHHGSDEQMFGVKKQVPHGGRSD
jgi:hypothetical protein